MTGTGGNSNTRADGSVHAQANRLRRRGFLSVIGTTLIAGCAGGNSTGGSGTPRGTTGSPAPEPTRSPTPSADEPSELAWPVRGVSFSPRSFEPHDYRTFFDLLAGANLAVRWAGEWTELGQEGGAPAGIAGYADASGSPLIVDTGVYSVSQRELFRPLDEAALEAYVEVVTTFAEEHHPPFLGLGTEVNLHAEDQPEQFELFVDLFDETAAAVQSVAPETNVYVSVQLEWLMGLRGGLFGGSNDPSQAQWDLLDRFPAADLVGLTSYPGLIYQEPATIPDDHYAQVAERTDRPLAIVETGWAHGGSAGGEAWASSEAEQAAFVERLGELTADLDVAALVWLYAYRLEGVGPPFDAMALRRDDGTARPAWDAWVEGSA